MLGPYVNFLTKRRRYADAIKQIDALLLRKGELQPRDAQALLEARKEIERLITDKRYNRRMTFWRPLYANTIGFGLLAFFAAFMLGPVILDAPSLISDLRNLHRLEAQGIPARGGNAPPPKI